MPAAAINSTSAGDSSRPFFSTAEPSFKLCARIAPAASPSGTLPNLIRGTSLPQSRRKPGPTDQSPGSREGGSRLSPGLRIFQSCRLGLVALAQHLGHLAEDRHRDLGLRYGADIEADRRVDARQLVVAEAEFAQPFEPL